MAAARSVVVTRGVRDDQIVDGRERFAVVADNESELPRRPARTPDAKPTTQDPTARRAPERKMQAVGLCERRAQTVALPERDAWRASLAVRRAVATPDPGLAGQRLMKADAKVRGVRCVLRVVGPVRLMTEGL